MSRLERFSTALRRRWRKLSQVLERRPVELVYGPGYYFTLASGLHDPRRGERVLAFLEQQGLLRESSLHEPHPVTLQLLRRVHDEAYLDALHHRDALTRAVGYGLSDSEHDALLAAQRLMTGGTVLATRLARASRGTAINLGGGFHHAFADRAERFCVFHDIAAAIADQRRQGFAGPILVVDLDLHDGDATRAHFADDASVHTFSIHNLTGTPREAVEATVLELGDGVGDDLYLTTLRRELPPVAERLRPELVFFLAGTDPAEDDKLGDWTITAEAMVERDRFVIDLIGQAEPDRGSLPGRVPLVMALAGGYGSDTWRHTARTVSWLLGGEVLEPPSTESMTLAGYRRLAARLRPSELTGEGPGSSEDWGLTEEDIYGALGGSTRKDRFLNYYSAHGVELALERAGIFDRLRALGYRHPNLAFDLDNASGETLRVYGSRHQRELLMELRVRRDKGTLRGFEMLRVEWLLLQNPRRAFSDRQPRLPGQAHPGLGMLRDVVALLVLVCDRLQLDGLLFVPSHFHTASQSRRVLRFVDPAAEGQFRALDDLLASLPLAAATRAVSEGRVRYRDTGETFRWQPVPMVLPVSDALESAVKGADYEAEAERARQAQRFDL
ncbi:MAG: histone deacetylase [Acidobacteriota bacterium]